MTQAMAADSVSVNVPTQPYYPSEEHLQYLKDKAKPLYDERRYSQSVSFNHWFDLFCERHRRLWAQLGGTRKEIPLSIEKGTIEGSLIKSHWHRDEQYNSWSAFCTLGALRKYGVLKADDRLFNTEGSGGRPDWLFTGKLRTGARVIKALGSDKECLYPLVDKCLEFHRYLKTQAQGGEYCIAIIAEPHHFLRLGRNRCDKSSCYRPGHDYNDAPGHIASSYDSVIYYLKEHDPSKIEEPDDECPTGTDKNAILARAWGFVDDDAWAFTNKYYNGDHSIKARLDTLIRLAMKDHMQMYVEEGLSVGYDADGGGTCPYMNGDWEGYRSPSRGQCNDFIIDTDVLGCVPYSSCSCCGDDLDRDSCMVSSDGDNYCPDCFNDNFTYCDMNHEYYPNDEMIYCEVHDQSYHESCVMELHDGEHCLSRHAVELYNGEFAWHSDDDLVLLAGVGYYAIADSCNDDLVELSPGSWALKDDCTFNEDTEEWELA